MCVFSIIFFFFFLAYLSFFFFFNDTATTEIYTLSLHDALPICALEGAAVGAGTGVVGAALAGIGIPKDSILRYETSLKADKFLLVAHGTPDEVERARGIVQTAGGSVSIHGTK